MSGPRSREAQSVRGWLGVVSCSWALLLVGCGGASPRAPTPASEVLAPIPARLDGTSWLDASAERAAEAGAGPLHVLAVGAGTLGDHLAGLVNVPKGRCALFLARGSASIEDIDLFVYGDDGTPFGSDEAVDAEPTLLVCADEGRRLYASARIAAGHGLVALGAQDVALEAAPRVARAVSARGFGAEEADVADTWPGLGEALAIRRRILGGQWEDQRRVAVPIDSRMPTHLSAQVRGGTCLDALAITTEGVAQLDLEVLDESGRIFGRGQGGQPRTLLVCSAEDVRVTFKLRPHHGRGLAVVALSSTRGGGLGDLDPDVPRALLVPPSLAKSAQLSKSPGTLRGFASTGGRTGLNLPWEGGCGRIDLRSEGDLVGLEAYLWTPDGSLSASEEGLGELVLFACSPRATLRLDVEATRRQGSFLVTKHRDRGTVSKALSRHPLAASRLLQRLQNSGHLDAPSRVGQVHELELTPTRIARLDLEVPAGRCRDIFAGLGEGAPGLELRLIHRITGEELEIARGPRSVQARACPGELSTLELRAELRVTSGRAVGLVATRLLDAEP